MRLFKQETPNWLLQYDLACHWQGGTRIDAASLYETAELICAAEYFELADDAPTLDEESRQVLETAVRRAVTDGLRKDTKFAREASSLMPPPEASKVMPAPSASKVMPSATAERATATVGRR